MLIFHQGVATTRLKTVFVIESFIQEIPTVKQVLLKGDTDSFIECFILFKLIYIFLKDLSNEHFVRTTIKLRYFVRESWSPIYFKKTVILNLSRIEQL